MYCFNCMEDCRPNQYRIKFINSKGELEVEDCCSIECCNKIINRYSTLHKQRYEDTVNQVFQRLK